MKRLFGVGRSKASDAVRGCEQAQAPVEDIGIAVLEELHKLNMIDEPWTERRERGFAWTPHRLRQEMTAGATFQDGEFTLCRILSRVRVVEQVAATTEAVETLLAEVNRFAVGSAYVYDPQARSISTFLVGQVHAETREWRVKQVAGFAACQSGQAETEADFLARKTGGRVATWDHPVSGRRHTPDESTFFVDAFFGREGNTPSRFTDEFEFQTIADIARQGNTATLGASSTGMCIEVPFANATTLIMLSSDWAHPRLGHGLSVKLMLPPPYDEAEIGRLAQMLNRKEMAGEFPYHSFGAWGRLQLPNGSGGLGHAMFLPNALHRQGVTLDAFYGTVHRARWVNRLLNPGHDESDAWKIMIDNHREVMAAQATQTRV
jgi:hypothetical protein